MDLLSSRRTEAARKFLAHSDESDRYHEVDVSRTARRLDKMDLDPRDRETALNRFLGRKPETLVIVPMSGVAMDDSNWSEGHFTIRRSSAEFWDALRTQTEGVNGSWSVVDYRHTSFRRAEGKIAVAKFQYSPARILDMGFHLAYTMEVFGAILSCHEFAAAPSSARPVPIRPRFGQGHEGSGFAAFQLSRFGGFADSWGASSVLEEVLLTDALRQYYPGLRLLLDQLNLDQARTKCIERLLRAYWLFGRATESEQPLGELVALFGAVECLTATGGGEGSGRKCANLLDAVPHDALEPCDFEKVWETRSKLVHGDARQTEKDHRETMALFPYVARLLVGAGDLVAGIEPGTGGVNALVKQVRSGAIRNTESAGNWRRKNQHRRIHPWQTPLTIGRLDY